MYFCILFSKEMPHRLMNFDGSMIALNVTSFLTLGVVWIGEHLTDLGGFIVMTSIAVLNLTKAYTNYKQSKK